MKHAIGGLFKRKEKKVKLVDADPDHEFREDLQDAVEAKAQYDELLKVAIHAAHQARGFAHSQQDLANCFLETFGRSHNGRSEDNDIADCFKRLGRVQAEIAKLLDNYSGHLHQTIIAPTSELQHELERMETSRKVYEDKKQAFEAAKSKASRQRRRTSWAQNGEEPFEDQAALQAQDEFDDAAMALGQQLMAIEQRRPKILFQQAARLHAAQMTLFTRALQNVHTIEPYIKDLSLQRHVDRRLPHADGYSDYEHEDEERSNADSVEHAPPSAWDDDLDEFDASPNAHLEIKDLPQEMAAEWSSLLHGLDQALQEMGEQTLDKKDAVFAVNALLMASTEGKRQQLSEHLYKRSHSGPLSLNTHSGSRSAPLSSTGVPLHLLNAAGGANAGPKTPPREETAPPGIEAARKPSLQVQLAAKGGPVSKSGPLTPTGANVAQSSLQTATTATNAARSFTRASTASRSSSYRAAKSGPVFPISAPGGSFGQPRSLYGQGPRPLSHHFPLQQGASSLLDSAGGKSIGSMSMGVSTKPRHSSAYASKSGPIIMTQPRGIPITPTGGGHASLPSNSIPYSLPTEASQGPPRFSSEPIIPKSGPIGRSPLAKSSISPNTSPPLSPPRNSPPLQDELYQLPAPPVMQVGSAPAGGNHFSGGGPLIRSADPVLPSSSGASEGDGPSILPPPPGAGKPLLRRNSSRERGEQAINGGNGLSINIPHQSLLNVKSARTRAVAPSPLSPIPPSEDGLSTPSPTKPQHTVTPHYLTQQPLTNGGPDENHIRRSMSFEGVSGSSKPAPPQTATSLDPPRRSPVPSMSPERPLVTISSPLPAMPPSTPPERPESQGALNALAGQEREELIKAVNSENFRWKIMEEAPSKGPKQVPELETLQPDQRERLLQTLARAVKSRREAFIDEHTHGFSDLPDDHLVQETC